jgi:hypothetical protein
MRTFILVSMAAVISLASSVATPASSDDVRVLCSFEKEELAGKGWKTEAWPDDEAIRVTGICSSTASSFGLLRKLHATHGRWALWERYDRGGGVLGGYPNRFSVEPRGKETERLSSYNSLLYARTDKIGGPDWSGFDYLCLDLWSGEGDLWLHTIIEDADATSPFARFHVKKGASTIAVPIARYADRSLRNPLDLKRILHLDVMPETTEADHGEVALDHLRLVRGAAPLEATLPCEEFIRDWGWSELAKKQGPIPPAEFKRENGPCEKVGPLTLLQGLEGLYGYLSGHDKLRYFTSVAAADNRRLLVVSHGGALASYDGGKTWGNLEGTAPEPTRLAANVGHGSANDGVGGNVYIANSTFPRLPNGFGVDRLGLDPGPECFKRFAFITASCHGGIRSVGLSVLSLRGERWQWVGAPNAPVSLFDDFTHHCPNGFDLVRTPGSRLWAFLDHNGDPGGSRGVRASFSDDNGLSWTPSHSTRFIGGDSSNVFMSTFWAAPYGDQVALIADGDGAALWTIFDGNHWSRPAAIEKARVRRVFALASGFQKTDQLVALVERDTNLVLSTFSGGRWGTIASDPVLDDGSKGPFTSPLLTVSGNTLFCFWVRDVQRSAAGVAHSMIVLRRYDLRTGAIAPEEGVVVEQEPISRLSAPRVSPPDFVPLVWANSLSEYARYGYESYFSFQKTGASRYPRWLRFLKLPNPGK